MVMSMQIKDISFQTKAVRDIVDAFVENNKSRVMCVSPTGTGKTIICRNVIIHPELHSALIRNPKRKTLRIIFKCHLERLLTQAKRRFPNEVVESSISNWADPNYISDNKIEIVYQMIGTKIPKDLDADLIIYDECHHEACNTVQEFLENAGHLPSLGLTATDERGDNCLIKFDVVIRPITRQEAVEQGYICQTDIRTIVDTSKNKVSLLKQILVAFNNEMKQTMIFVRTKAEIKQVVDFINTELAELARGCDDDCDIDALLDDFAIGEYKFCVSCRKLGEGLDIPGVTDVIFARNIGSYIDLNQYIGRASRTDVMECRVWEFVTPLSGSNLDTTEVVGLPKSHLLINRVNDEFIVRDFM